MATEAGLSIKDRLAMLQASNKNPQLSGPMKAPTPAPTTAPTTAPKPTTTQTHNKTPPISNNSTQENDSPPQLAFKLRPTGAKLDGKATPLVPNKPNNPDTKGSGVVANSAKSNDSCSGATTTPTLSIAGGALIPRTNFQNTNNSASPPPPVFKKPTVGNAPSAHETVTMRERNSENSQNSPRPPSIQERMAALKGKAGEGGAETKPNFGAPKGSTFPQNKFSTSPQQNVSSSPNNVPQKAGSQATPGSMKPSDLIKNIKEAAERKREGKKVSDLFLRHSDGKRFRKLDVSSAMNSSGTAPAKPASLDNVDLTTFLQVYVAAKEKKLKADAARSEDAPEAASSENEDVEELYIEAGSTSVALRLRGKGSIKKAGSVRVSEIPEFTELEEEHELYIDSQSAQAPVSHIPETPEEEYEECASSAAAVGQYLQQAEPEDPEDIYEPLDEEISSKPAVPVTPLPSPGPSEDKKAKKEKDKSKEELSKKEEKERRKKEEDIKKQRAKFGLKETDVNVGEGVVKNNASGGVFNKDLAVTKGEMIAILRMDNNPQGKWLVQNNSGKLGYVSSNNIEVATPAIQQAGNGLTQEMMSGGVKQAEQTADYDEEPEELYEALPEEEVEEIYEEL